MNEPVQDATLFFFVPLIVTYLAACAGWWLLTWWRPATWPKPELVETDRCYLDLGLMFAAAVGILLLGQVWQAGIRLPRGEVALLNALARIFEDLVIYSPLFIVLAIRQQPLSTIYLSHRGLWKKALYGIGLGIFSVILFLTLRGELDRLPHVLRGVFAVDRLTYFVAVFLEGAALAFAFVRLRWTVGLWPALIIPALLFALSHVPGSLAEGRSLAYIAAFFVVNSGLVVAILYVVQRSRDIIWIGLVHYLMDIAIKAF